MSADIITARAVRVALRQLSTDRTPPESPLADLDLVTRLLERHGSPASRSSRQWALGQVLGEIVEAELARLRATTGAPEPTPEAGRADAAPSTSGTPAGARRPWRDPDPKAALARLRLDFCADEPALEGCSTVYHLYLRPDLRLSTTRLAGLVAGRHPRTVQRRLGLGLDLITRRLRALEAAAMAQRQRDELRRRLPVPSGGQAVGVERTTALLRAWWSDPGRPAALVLSGPGGSGKSTAAAAFVRRLLDADQVTRAAWLRACDRRPALPAMREEAPSGRWSMAVVEAARDDVPSGRADPCAGRVGRTATTAGAVLAACGALGSGFGDGALVIVDGVDDAREAWAVASAIERLGAGARLLITSRLGWGPFLAAEVVPMPALGAEAALALLRHECRRRALHGVAAASDRTFEGLVTAAAGHPAALLLAAGELRTASIDTVAERLRLGIGRAGDLGERMWAGVWRSAPTSVRQAVDGVAALERAGRVAHPAAIAAATGLACDEAEAAVGAALDLGLLSAGPEGGVSFRTPSFLAIWRANGGGSGR